MASPLLLEGRTDSPQPDDRDALIEGLRSTNRKLDEALRLERNKVGAIGHALRELRMLTDPFYKLLKRIHGELDDAGIEGYGDGGNTPAASNSRWDAIKSRMPPRHAQAIDVLLLQGSMKRTQIASALKMDYANCANNVIKVLKAQGWIVENGGNLSLKDLG